ncbi:MAG TPA: TonB family protein [Pyrinomonadaceae bacterium]|jgi:TonB family protein
MLCPRHTLTATLIVTLSLCLSTPGGSRASFAQTSRPATNPQSASAQDDKTRGIALYQTGETKEAIKALRAAVKGNKADADAWHYLGLALSGERKLKDAREAFEQALTLRPDFTEARAAYADALMLDGRWAEAEREAVRVLKSDPRNAEAHYVLGEARYNQRRWRSAFDEAAAALKSKPDFTQALFLKGDSLRAIVNEEFPAATKEQLEALISLLKETVGEMDALLKRNPNPPQAERFRQILTILRPYAAGDFENFVYKPTVVMSKAKILSKPYPEGGGQQGTVLLQVVLRANGEVGDIHVLSASNDKLAELAVEAARKIKFTPAMKDGRAVSQYIRVEYNFL